MLRGIEANTAFYGSPLPGELPELFTRYLSLYHGILEVR
jgi:hypothetical protein